MADDETKALAQLQAAYQWLMRADSADDVVALHDLAAAAEAMAKRAKWGTTAANAATTIRLLCLIRLRPLIEKGQQAGDIMPRGGSVYRSDRPIGERPKTMADLGITNRMLTDMRSLASAYDVETIERLRDEADAADKPLSYPTIVREARYLAAHERRDRQAAEDARFVDENPPNIDLRLGHLATALDDLAGTVDAIITDPPYERDALPLLGDLRDLATRLLKPDGVMVVMFGTYYLREAFNLLDGGVPYRWTAAYLTPGAHAVHYHARITQGWKPLLVYGGGPRFHDVFTSPGDDKRHHMWGQSFGGFLALVDTFSRPGQLVVDPFLGGGTTALACQRLQRSFVGCDIDPAAVETSRQRVTSRWAIDDQPADLEDDAEGTSYDDEGLILGEVIPFEGRSDG